MTARIADPLERRIASLLTAGTYAAIAIETVGVVLLLASGIDPFVATAEPFAPDRLIADLLALRPVAVIWVGILLLIALPVGRVGLEGVGYLRDGDRRLAGLAGGILFVVAISIAVALIPRT